MEVLEPDGTDRTPGRPDRQGLPQSIQNRIRSRDSESAGKCFIRTQKRIFHKYHWTLGLWQDHASQDYRRPHQARLGQGALQWECRQFSARKNGVRFSAVRSPALANSHQKRRVWAGAKRDRARGKTDDLSKVPGSRRSQGLRKSPCTRDFFRDCNSASASRELSRLIPTFS